MLTEKKIEDLMGTLKVAASVLASSPGTLSLADSLDAPESLPISPENALSPSSTLRSQVEALNKKLREQHNTAEANMRWCSFGGSPFLDGLLQVLAEVTEALDKILMENPL